MSKIFESTIEELIIEFLQKQGWQYVTPEAQELERESLSDVILKARLHDAIERLNKAMSADAKEQALKTVLRLPTQDLIANNEAFHRMLTDGIEVEVMSAEGIKGEKVKLIDNDNIYNNEFVVCNQFTVIENNINKRPDVVLFVNGLPLVVIELKNAADENATVQKAFTQLQNYKNAIPSLFYYNSILIASDGLDAKVGTISSDYSRFLAWKTSDGQAEDRQTIPQMETLSRGLLNKHTLLDVISHFIVFEKGKHKDRHTGQIALTTIKKVAAYHQYYAVNKAVTSTIRASAVTMLPDGFMVGEKPETYGLTSTAKQLKGDHKAGVVWHTQGSGKSLSMVFYAGKIVLALQNPTLIVLTDRNDLDEQLFDTFANCKQLLRQDPVQAGSRDHLKKLLKVAGGGIVFTTIQKFFPEDGSAVYDELSDRTNIVVIADEAHRSQYGFAAKTTYTRDGAKVSYGFAKYIRDALPNASFIGFTGTPIEKADMSTPAVFGNYIDVYDVAKAVQDNATVKIYYESRLAKVHLKAEEKEQLDEEVESITEDVENYSKEQAKAKWAQLESIVGHRDRLRVIAEDIVNHYEARQEVFEGKAMIVCMSRRIAVDLYQEIITIRPEWHNTELQKGALKVIMTSTSSDPENYQIHNTSKQDRKDIGARFKDPNDPLKLVIVRDMWLTGFDVPCLNTMYVDKLMTGHNLMQAIARVNRIFKDKPGGLIVDYIGIAYDLKKALATYTASGGKGKPALNQEEAIAKMIEKFEIIDQMFDKFNYQPFFTTTTQKKLALILEAQEYILGIDDGKDRFIKQVDLLSGLFALSVPHPKAMMLKDEVGFFQAVKARLVKFEPIGKGKSNIEIETAIKQIVDKAVVSEGVIDVFDAAGIKKPDISILSDDFLAEIQGMDHKNLAVELLKKLLNDEIRSRIRKNMTQSKKLSEMLEAAIKRYQNNLLTTAQIIEELIKLAKQIREADKRGEIMKLSDDELAFYDALANNESAMEVLGDTQLRDLSRVLVDRVKKNTAIDWTLKESVQAKLRVIVRRTLRQYGYPPDAQLLATENVLKQAELLADDWSQNSL